MNKNECQYEQRVREFAAGRDDDAEIGQHIAGCGSCGETAKVIGWMNHFARQTQIPRDLRPAGSILFKARLIGKQTAARRALLPIVWMKAAAAGLAIFGLVILQLIGGSGPGSIVAASLRSFMAIAPFAIMAVVCAALLCLGVERLFREPKTDARR